MRPGDPDIIEYAGDPLPRLWMIRRDGTQNRCLYENAKHEFIVHESFLGPSDDLIFAVWPYRLGRMNIHDRKMQTIADLVKVHISTISRAIKGKHIQTPYGLFPMRYFFTGGVGNADGEVESRRKPCPTLWLKRLSK